jgi:hypothetical protein
MKPNAQNFFLEASIYTVYYTVYTYFVVGKDNLRTYMFLIDIPFKSCQGRTNGHPKCMQIAKDVIETACFFHFFV